LIGVVCFSTKLLLQKKKQISGRSGWYIDSLSFTLRSGRRLVVPSRSESGKEFCATAQPGLEFYTVEGMVGGHLHGLAFERCVGASMQDITAWARRCSDEQRARIRCVLILRARPDNVWNNHSWLTTLMILEWMIRLEWLGESCVRLEIERAY
jgi:hypothetical protein